MANKPQSVELRCGSQIFKLIKQEGAKPGIKPINSLLDQNTDPLGSNRVGGAPQNPMGTPDMMSAANNPIL